MRGDNNGLVPTATPVQTERRLARHQDLHSQRRRVCAAPLTLYLQKKRLPVLTLVIAGAHHPA